MTVIYNGPLTLPTETQLPVTTVTYTAKTKLIVAFIGGAADYDSFLGNGPTFIMGRRQKSYIDKLQAKFKNATVTGDLYYKEIGKGAVINFESVLSSKGTENSRVRCYYYGYDKAETALYEKIKADVGSSMRSDKYGLIIVGHSLGGWKAAKLVEKLTETNVCSNIDLLITLDPVGETYFMNLFLPDPRPQYWINVFTNGITVVSKDAKGKKSSSIESDNIVAALGNRWDLDSEFYANKLSLNIDAADIGHGNAEGMMVKPKDGISVDKKLMEITEYYLS